MLLGIALGLFILGLILIGVADSFSSDGLAVTALICWVIAGVLIVFRFFQWVFIST